MVVGPLLGALADRLGIWRVLLIGAVLFVVLLPFLALAPDWITLGLAWAIVSGIAVGV